MYYHLVLEVRGRLAWFTTPERLRAALRVLANSLGEGLLLFGLVDEHGHAVVVAESRADAGYIASGLNRALRHLGADVGPTHVTEVEDARHLANLISYMERQPWKHPIAPDPADWEGTCFADLVGARRGILNPARIAEALPRIDVGATALAALGLRGPVIAASDADILALGARPLWSAAHAAFAAPVEGRLAVTLAARGAYATIGRAAGLPVAELRLAAGASRSGWHRMAGLVSPAEDQLAVRLQLGLRALIAANPITRRHVPASAPAPVLRWER